MKSDKIMILELNQNNGNDSTKYGVYYLKYDANCIGEIKIPLGLR